MRVVGVVQARMGSSRLPGKMLMEVGGRSLIQHVCDRLRLCDQLDDLVVATSTSETDDLLARKVEELGCHVYRGSETDVLDRVYGAGRSYGADAVVRMTGDCPLIDPREVDRVVSVFRTSDALDYCALGYTYPEGFGAEVVRFRTLEAAWSEASAESDREHVTPYIQRAKERFSARWVDWNQDLSAYRVTVDEEEDLEVVAALVDALISVDAAFGLEAVVGYLQANPSVANTNAHVARSGAWRSKSNEPE